MKILSLPLSLLAAALAATPAFAQSQIVKIDGSSTVFPVTEAVAEDFQKAKKQKVKVTVGISGTGGGFKKFCRGETDISNASRPILKAEMADCQKAGIEYVELQVAIDGLTVVVNPGNTFATCLTVEELAKIYGPDSPENLTWKDVRADFPADPINRFMPGADSGTFDYFTEVVNGEVDASTSFGQQSEDDNVLVTGVAGDVNAISYFGYAYYVENTDKLKAVEVDGGDGCVAPSADTASDDTYVPLSRPVFIYVSKKAADERPEIARFVEFYLKEGRALVKEVGYIPLPDEAYRLVIERFQKRQPGSLFEGGSKIGVTIEELLEGA